MALTRKDLFDQVMIKPDSAVLREDSEGKAVDMKALDVLVNLLSPIYQCMIRECKSAIEA